LDEDVSRKESEMGIVKRTASIVWESEQALLAEPAA
jgi:hypothetical protein